MDTFHNIMRRMNQGGGITVTIQDRAVKKALLQYCQDNKNTRTMELPRLDDLVTRILRRFLIDLRGND